MTVVAIHLGAPRTPELWAVESVRAVAGKGLEGDRHFDPAGAPPGGALTLVEEEIVDMVGLPPGGTRRQLTVRGIRLNGLIGKRFRVGEVQCYGVALCEPCRHLERLTRPGIIKDLVHRAGINADILTDGTIAVGDTITSEDELPDEILEASDPRQRPNPDQHVEEEREGE
jgi:MOSC domain-containing protein YiiM